MTNPAGGGGLKPAVFFDRDGVLNVDRRYVHRPEDFEWVAGAREAVRRFNEAGWLVFVVTNQSGVARGYYGEGEVRALHDWMSGELALIGARVDEFAYCPHHPQAPVERYRLACDCRKPAPGMLLELMRRWPIDAARSLLIGDNPHDVEAARAAGVEGLLFQGGDLLAFIEAEVAALGVPPAT